jgi:predicted nucleic acid-binding protein
VRGFRQLSDGHVRLVVPLPIVFEVYKWLLYNVSADAARSALTQIRRLTQIAHPSSTDFDRAARTVHAMPEWGGSLEDALLAWTALTLRVPLWTLNHRDFAAFRDLSFWNPL